MSGTRGARKLSRALTRIIVILTMGYVLVCLALAFAQRSFIYPAPEGRGDTPSGFERVTYSTADGLELQAGYRVAQAGMPTILYLHGNGADWQSSVVATDRLVPEGFGVLAAEYRGYRGNPGSPSERGFYTDGEAAIDFLAAHGVESKQLVIIGNSIGSGVATEMAKRHHPHSLVLISPFTSLPDVVAEKFWWVPARLLVQDQFDNLAKLPAIDAPVLILHGEADRLIPDHHGRQLAVAARTATLCLFPEAGHDLAWKREAGIAVLDFLEKLHDQD